MRSDFLSHRWLQALKSKRVTTSRLNRSLVNVFVIWDLTLIFGTTKIRWPECTVRFLCARWRGRTKSAWRTSPFCRFALRFCPRYPSAFAYFLLQQEKNLHSTVGDFALEWLFVLNLTINFSLTASNYRVAMLFCMFWLIFFRLFSLLWPLVAFYVKYDLAFESYSINLPCYYTLLALFHTLMMMMRMTFGICRPSGLRRR